jgi:hypothetical protein
MPALPLLLVLPPSHQAHTELTPPAAGPAFPLSSLLWSIGLLLAPVAGSTPYHSAGECGARVAQRSKGGLELGDWW